MTKKSFVTISHPLAIYILVVYPGLSHYLNELRPKSWTQSKYTMKWNKCPVKLAAVRMLDEGRSANSICKELHVGLNSLRVWYQQYKRGGEERLLPKVPPRLSYAEKILIIEDIVKNSISLTVASIKYELACETLRRWLIAYRSSGPNGLRRKNESTMSKKKRNYTDEELDELEQLRRRNEWLEAENALLKKVRALVEEKEARLRATGQKPSKN